jgi:hypothetical protein
LILLFFISLFVVRWEKIHWLVGVLTLLTIYNVKELKITKIKKISKSSVLSVIAMLFPAVLYAKSNAIYFKDLGDIVVYFLILITFSAFLPVIIYIFNNRLSVINIIKYSTAFILSAMFLPLIRNFINYSQNVPIDFICLLALVLFIINLIYKHRKMLVIFFLCATTYIIFSSINLNNMGTDMHAVSIPKELLKMKMKDTPSIYLFMHDAFPHRDLIKELNLDCSELDELLKKYDFKEYDVYSLGKSTLLAMDSIFTLVKPDNTTNLSDLNCEKLRRGISSNLVQKLLTYKGYINFIEAPEGHRYVFNETVRKAYSAQSALFSSKGETRNEMSPYLIQALAYGTMNTMVLDNMIIESKANEKTRVFKLSNFVCLDGIKNRDKIFG